MNTVRPPNKLATCRIVGFFSLPPSSLAEHNPAAYTAACASAPPGAGTCSQCGNGIRHHVVITDADGGNRRFIGTDCAVRVGLPAGQIRDRLTDEARAAKEARCAAASAEWSRKQEAALEETRARCARRQAAVGFLVALLNATNNPFYQSLASQLAAGPLSRKQAAYAVKVTSSTGRRNKKNAEAWDRAEWLMTASDEELETAAGDAA